MNLRQTIFNYVCARQTHRSVSFPNWDHVSSVMVLYESEWQERNDSIRSIIKQLQAQGKQVVSLGYVSKDNILSAKRPDSRILGKHDCNLLLKPKAEVLQALKHREIDVLLDLTTTPILPLQYVAMLTTAKFKIAIHPSPFYDMVIQCATNAEVPFIFKQMIHYLSTIKSADNVRK